MIIKTLFPSAVTLHRPWPPILISHLFYSGLFLVLDCSFFTARVFLVEISLLFLEITSHLLVTYMQNTGGRSMVKLAAMEVVLPSYAPNLLLHMHTHVLLVVVICTLA